MPKDMILNNSFVPNAVIFQSKTVLNMETTSLNSNANFVVPSLNGFAGETLIFVNHAIKSNVMEIMYQNIQKINFRNVLAQESAR